MADELGLDQAGADDERLAQLFGGQVIPIGAEPLAQAYAGHQFGHFNPQLGDGRALLLGEVIDRYGHRRDIQLKGSGPTPFSRNGDGMAALGPVLREYIVCGSFRSRSASRPRGRWRRFRPANAVYRETMLPGAVFTRVAASHIRRRHLPVLRRARRHRGGVRTLADHVIDRHYPEGARCRPPLSRPARRVVAERQARLIARWLSVGFIHGVMNTDNMAISGETIDFGPCAFLDEYDPGKVFSSIDQRGRYAYANQPGIGQWNIARLAECLLPLLDADEEKAVEAANGCSQGLR
ncbi:MAG: protein adenylyltransferase SelO family protein [Rhizobium sp.]|nr:protein adenylyltransferase SelO family protein [Rhizobium sp.]